MGELGRDSNDWSESKDPAIVHWKLVRQAIEHENELINHRQTWLLISQTLFFGGYFAMLQQSFKGPPEVQNPTLARDAMNVISLIGSSTCFLLWASIRAAHHHISRLERWYCHKYEEEERGERRFRARDVPYINGMFAESHYRIVNPQYLPLMFFLAWTMIFVEVNLASWNVVIAGVPRPLSRLGGILSVLFSLGLLGFVIYLMFERPRDISDYRETDAR